MAKEWRSKIKRIYLTKKKKAKRAVAEAMEKEGKKTIRKSSNVYM